MNEHDIIFKGSVQDMAKRKNMPLAEVLFDVDAIIGLDVSGSMNMKDVEADKLDQSDIPDYMRDDFISRLDAAKKQLRTLQSEYEGKVAVYAFGTSCQLLPSGNPDTHTVGTGSTKVLTWLREIQDADGTGIKFYLITDGVNTSSDEACYEMADKMETSISGIYIGPKSGWDYEKGQRFLTRLCSGVDSVVDKAAGTGLFLEEMKKTLFLTG